MNTCTLPAPARPTLISDGLLLIESPFTAGTVMREVGYLLGSGDPRAFARDCAEARTSQRLPSQTATVFVPLQRMYSTEEAMIGGSLSRAAGEDDDRWTRGDDALWTIARTEFARRFAEGKLDGLQVAEDAAA